MVLFLCQAGIAEQDDSVFFMIHPSKLRPGHIADPALHGLNGPQYRAGRTGCTGSARIR